jgi:hypothetical protein
MASLTSLRGHGGGRIPTAAGQSYHLSRRDLARVVEQVLAARYPYKGRSAALQALATDPDAARLLRESAAVYCAGTATARTDSLHSCDHL